MTDAVKPIWVRHRAIYTAKNEAYRKWIEQYEESIFKPALKALQEECAAAGHGPLKPYDYTCGYSRHEERECFHCGAKIKEND